MFFTFLFFSFLFFFLFICLCCPALGWQEQRKYLTYIHALKWLQAFLNCHYTSIYATRNYSQSFIPCYSMFQRIIVVYSMTSGKGCLPYFTFHFTFQSGHCRASCFLSREWHFTPSGSFSLWSPLHVAATIIPCATFKHVPFALQFVQPGIIITLLNPLAPQPHIEASLWVSPIPGLFCPLQGSILCFSCPVCFYSGRRAKRQSTNPPTQPLGKLITYQEEHSCWVYVHACTLWAYSVD